MNLWPIYARMSDDDAPGVERQVKLCRELAARLGLPAGEVFFDNDRSATSGKVRPAFERLLVAPKPGILAWHPDRLIRVMRDLERVILLDVPVHTVEAGHIDLSTPSGRMVARQLTAVAQYEGEHKAARQRAASRQRAEAGHPPPGAAFGYAHDGMTPEPAEAEAIRSAAEGVLSGALSLREVARRWNAAGHLTRLGHAWTPLGVKRVLTNPRIAAVPHYRFELLPGVEPRWPAIVEVDVWRGLCAMLADPERRTAPPPDRRYLLSWLARCGACGAPMQTGATAAKVRTLKCSAARHLERAAEPIEDWVRDVALARLRKPDAVELLTPQRPDLGPLRVRRRALDEQRTATAKDTDLPLDVVKIRVREFDEQLAALDDQIAEATRGSLLAKYAGLTLDGWRDLDLASQRGIIAEMMTVTVLPVGQGARTFRKESVRLEPRPTSS